MVMRPILKHITLTPTQCTVAPSNSGVMASLAANDADVGGGSGPLVSVLELCLSRSGVASPLAGVGVDEGGVSVSSVLEGVAMTGAEVVLDKVNETALEEATAFLADSPRRAPLPFFAGVTNRMMT
jgi:hypothetical protein